jgi:hypothetical protein
MAESKKFYSAKEAALAVLAKTEEMLKSHTLMKAETENKKAPSNSQKPRIEEKPTERDYGDFETKPGHAPVKDHGTASQPAPGNNPHEAAEGNNADWGTSPQVKGHIKLAHFIGRHSAKKGAKQPNSNIGTAMGGPAAPQSAPSASPAPAAVKKGIALS